MASTMATNRSAVHNNVRLQPFPSVLSLDFEFIILIDSRLGLTVSAIQQVQPTTLRWAIIFLPVKIDGITTYGRGIHSALIASRKAQ